MLEYIHLLYPCSGSGIRTGDCIVLFVAMNAGVYIIRSPTSTTPGQALVLARALCSQECCSTMHSPATPGQALLFAQVIEPLTHCLSIRQHSDYVIQCSLSTRLLLRTSAPLVLCYDQFDRGSRQVKRDLVDLVTEDYDIALRWRITTPDSFTF